MPSKKKNAAASKANKASESLKGLVESMLPKPKPAQTKSERERASLISNFLTNGKGKFLLTQGFTLDSEGLWHVYGQNQSAGGMFDRDEIPDFGLYEGRLIDVLNDVIERRGWNGWTNNGGEIKVGKIQKPKIKKV